MEGVYIGGSFYSVDEIANSVVTFRKNRRRSKGLATTCDHSSNAIQQFPDTRLIRQCSNDGVSDLQTTTRVIKSKSGDVVAIFRQTNAQKNSYQKYGNFLFANIYSSSDNPHKKLLSISVIGDADVPSTVCNATLISPFSRKTLQYCLKIFVSLNNPGLVQCVVVGQEELFPAVRQFFPSADHLLSFERMLNSVTSALSKYCLSNDVRKRIVDAFRLCCSTSSESEFGFAEDYLTSLQNGLGDYFANTWFQQTNIWRALDKLHRARRGNDTEKLATAKYNTLAKIGFFK